MNLISRGGIAATALAACSLAGCSASVSVGKTINTDKAEKLIAASVGKQVGGKVTVDCPSDVKAKKGGTFTCKAKDSDGNTATVNVTQTDDKGGISFSVKP